MEIYVASVQRQLTYAQVKTSLVTITKYGTVIAEKQGNAVEVHA